VIKRKVNPASEAVPPGVVTDTLPEVPAPTIAVMLVGEFTVKEVAAVPPKLTANALLKFVPVIDTVVSAPALFGVNEEIVGAGIKVNPAREAVPPGVVTDMLPDVPAATTAVMFVEEFTVKEVAAVPPKLTANALLKLVPVMVTVVLAPALVGVNEEIVGAGIKVNPAREAVPPGVVTDTLPDVPAATTAVMFDGEFIVKEVANVPPKLTADALLKFVPVMVTLVSLPA
jgi:hypothetical protein